ncbi:hypothetical protein [uncultured Roseobacter sp.]|uniref:hypothetical protein n=1 Tax=uncultured Roseobacter sp. TaxID=114847 RepID=UPI002610736A|nr:hypothetical protein [uncultured Roseobacter sp.]
MTSVRVDVLPAISGVLPQAFVLTPTSSDPAPPVIAVHGIRREAELMTDLLSPMAAASGRTVVLPVFDEHNWKRFQKAACAQRSDLALLRLLARLRKLGIIDPGRFDLSGYSGGGQFAHRFAWFYPHLVGRLCAAAPGWWTFPDSQVKHPFGIGDRSETKHQLPLLMRANLVHFLDREIVVRVGGHDTERDQHLRTGSAIDAQQGYDRLERSRNWCSAVKQACEEYGIQPRIDFRVLPDCTHSFADCVSQAELHMDFVVSADRPVGEAMKKKAA